MAAEATFKPKINPSEMTPQKNTNKWDQLFKGAQRYQEAKIERDKDTIDITSAA